MGLAEVFPEGKLQDVAEARLISPRQLTPNAEHIAVIVPAFRADGTNSWTNPQEVVLSRYHHWRFRTGNQGDFRTLSLQSPRRVLWIHAEVLRAADTPADLAQDGRRRTGPG